MKTLVSQHDHLTHIWRRWYERRTTVYIRVAEEVRNNNFMNHCGAYGHHKNNVVLFSESLTTMTRIRTSYQRFRQQLLRPPEIGLKKKVIIILSS